MGTMEKGIVGFFGVAALAAALAVLAVSVGCGKKDDSGASKPAGEPPKGGEAETAKPGGDQGGGDVAWPAGPTSLKASWESSGVATKDAVLKGTFYVGPNAVRLDVDNHPNAGHPVSFIRVHGEDDLWQIDATTKSYDRALSGDWEHNVIPTIVDEDDADDLRACPFGRASDKCKKLGDETIATIAVQKWQNGNRTLWIAPSLRVGVKEEYTPFRNNPETQGLALTNIQTGEQDAALFTVPADFECKAGGFCRSAPK